MKITFNVVLKLIYLFNIMFLSKKLFNFLKTKKKTDYPQMFKSIISNFDATIRDKKCKFNVSSLNFYLH